MKSIIACILLTGCTYRYDTGSFTNDPPPANMPAAYPPQLHEPAPVPTAPPTCSPETEEQLEVTNKLDSKTQTIQTTATTHRTMKPCKLVFDAQ